MDEERVVAQVTRTGIVTGKFLLKSLYLASKTASTLLSEYRANRVFHGEAEWNAFLATSGKKEIQEFLNNEVNLTAFKKELERYGVGFAFKENGDGTTTLAYHFKNKAIVESALKRVLSDIQKKPQEFVRKVMKTPRNMSPKEKTAYYSRVMKKEGTFQQAVKKATVRRREK